MRLAHFEIEIVREVHFGLDMSIVESNSDFFSVHFGNGWKIGFG